MFARISRLRSAVSLDLSDDSSESAYSSSTLTDIVPPLTRGNSIASTSSEAETDLASMLPGGGYTLESHNGVLSLPYRFDPNADLLCPFQILDCDETFSDVREFKTHVFSHFGGQPLPTVARCFLCDNNYTQTLEDDAAWAWNNMLGHMAHEHFRQGQQLATIRTDFNLMRWMYDRKIITDHQFKRTQLCPLPTLLPSANRGASEILHPPEAPSPPSSPSRLSYVPTSPAHFVGYQSQPYVVFAGSRAERRRRDATRTVIRSQARAYAAR